MPVQSVITVPTDTGLVGIGLAQAMVALTILQKIWQWDSHVQEVEIKK